MGTFFRLDQSLRTKPVNNVSRNDPTCNVCMGCNMDYLLNHNSTEAMADEKDGAVFLLFAQSARRKSACEHIRSDGWGSERGQYLLVLPLPLDAAQELCATFVDGFNRRVD
jgi:hypothetical protein